MIEVYPPSTDQIQTLGEMREVVERKIKRVELKLKDVQELIGIQDMKENFVMENKFFETVCSLRQFLFTVKGLSFRTC